MRAFTGGGLKSIGNFYVDLTRITLYLLLPISLIAATLFVIAGMPQTSAQRVYEVWVKRSGAPQPTDALFTVTANGDATVGVPGSVAGVKVVMVTSEPLGGSKVPTSPPVIIAHLS